MMRGRVRVGLGALLSVVSLLVGCQPSPETIATKVQAQLQQRIDDFFHALPADIAISKLVVVQEQGRKYQGVATVNTFGVPLTVKLSILADAKQVIYDTDWNQFSSSVYAQELKLASGKSSDVVVTNPSLLHCLPPLLREDRANHHDHSAFAKRLEVRHYTKQIGNFVFGEGCQAHLCTVEEAAWAIEGSQCRGFAIVKKAEQNRQTLETFKALNFAPYHFDIYGADNYDDLPPPLLQWATEHGMAVGANAVMRHEGDEFE